MSNFDYEGFNEEAIDLVIEKGGRSKQTLQKEALVLKSFTNFVTKEPDIESLDALWSNKAKLDSILAKYFFCWRLKNGEFPKRNTVELFKSFLKNIILKNTHGQWDISKSCDFPKFTKFYQG